MVNKNKIENRAKKDDTVSVSGSYLLNVNPDHLSKKYGMKIIHQSWKSTVIPDKYKKWYDSWKKYIPNACFVLWTDEDNRNLVKKFYPDLLKTFDELPLVIQKCDLVRLLYLHRFGGTYADLDYEVYTNIFETEQLKKNISNIYVVESYILLNEVMQNSLMISRIRNHNYWLQVAHNIKRVHEFIKDPSICEEKNFGGRKLVWVFDNIFTKRIANMFFTQYMTGPAMLDKTYVQMSISSRKVSNDICLLSSEDFYLGKHAAHHHSNSWVHVGRAFKNIIIFLLVCSCTLVIVFSVYSYKKGRRKQAKIKI